MRTVSKGEPVEDSVQNPCVCTRAHAKAVQRRARLVVGVKGGLEQTVRYIFKSFTSFSFFKYDRVTENFSSEKNNPSQSFPTFIAVLLLVAKRKVVQMSIHRGRKENHVNGLFKHWCTKSLAPTRGELPTPGAPGTNLKPRRLGETDQARESTCMRSPRAGG